LQTFATPLRNIQLQADIEYPLHAVHLPAGQFCSVILVSLQGVTCIIDDAFYKFNLTLDIL